MKSRELLEHLLAGNELSPDELDALLREETKEGQYLDYKDGGITTREKLAEGRRIIREWVNAFANSDGGVLVVGVDESMPRRISSCTTPGKESLDKWVESLLHDMAPYFSPQPRFFVVHHPAGDVLLVAVARAPQLVPCVESRRIKYFLRINQSTLEVPDYLISDLVLGRRQHPALDMTEPRIDFRHDEGKLRLEFSFRVENGNLVFAEDVEVGIVSWSLVQRPWQLNLHLLSYLDSTAPQQLPDGSTWSLVHYTNRSLSRNPINLSPFTTQVIAQIGPVHFPSKRTWCETALAVYVMARHCPPTWFELLFRCNANFLSDAPELQREESRISLMRAGVVRPHVRWSSD